MVETIILERIMGGPVAKLLETYKVVIGILIAFAYIALIVLLVINITKLGGCQDHPLMRKKILNDLIVVFVCLILVSIFTFLYVLVLRMALGTI